MCCGVSCFGLQTLPLFTAHRQTGESLSLPNERGFTPLTLTAFPDCDARVGATPTQRYRNAVFLKRDSVKLVRTERAHSTQVNLLYVCIFSLLQ